MSDKGHLVPERTLRAFGLWKEPRALRAFTNGYETVVAKDSADATECLKEHIGYVDDDLEGMNEWEEIPDGEYLEIRQEELHWHLDRQKDIPMPKDYVLTIRAKISQWIEACGRTVLCSTEW